MDELRQAVKSGNLKEIAEIAKRNGYRIFQNVGTGRIYAANTPWEIQTFEGSLSFREIC